MVSGRFLLLSCFQVCINEDPTSYGPAKQEPSEAGGGAIILLLPPTGEQLLLLATLSHTFSLAHLLALLKQSQF